MSNNVKDLNTGHPPMSSRVASGIAASDSFPNMVSDTCVSTPESQDHEVSLDDDDAERVGTPDSDDSLPTRPTDPATGKWKVKEGSQPVLYLPFEEAGYWNVHGHAPPGCLRTQDLDNNDLKIFETYYCADTQEDWNRFHPEIRLPVKEGRFWLQHGRLPSDSTLTHDLDGKLLVPHSTTSEPVADRS